MGGFPIKPIAGLNQKNTLKLYDKEYQEECIQRAEITELIRLERLRIPHYYDEELLEKKVQEAVEEENIPLLEWWLTIRKRERAYLDIRK